MGLVGKHFTALVEHLAESRVPVMRLQNTDEDLPEELWLFPFLVFDDPLACRPCHGKRPSPPLRPLVPLYRKTSRDPPTFVCSGLRVHQEFHPFPWLRRWPSRFWAALGVESESSRLAAIVRARWKTML